MFLIFKVTMIPLFTLGQNWASSQFVYWEIAIMIPPGSLQFDLWLRKAFSVQQSEGLFCSEALQDSSWISLGFRGDIRFHYFWTLKFPNICSWHLVVSELLTVDQTPACLPLWHGGVSVCHLLQCTAILQRLPKPCLVVAHSITLCVFLCQPPGPAPLSQKARWAHLQTRHINPQGAEEIMSLADGLQHVP